MMFVVTFIEIIVSHEVDDFPGTLCGFPLYVIGGERRIGVLAVIQFAYCVVQFICYFQPAVKIGVIYFISNPPYEDARVVPVLAHPARQILFPPLLKVIAIIVIGFRALPHIETLGIKEKTQFIAEVEQMLCRHIVGAADRVDAHLFQREELAAQRRLVHRGAEGAEDMVFTRSLDRDMLAIEEKAMVGIKRNRAEPQMLAQGILSLPIKE